MRFAPLASAAAGLITVVNAAPGGGTSNPEVLYVVAPQSAIAASTLATSTSVSGTTTASLGGGTGTAGSLNAAASGAGTLALAQYGADPVTTTPPTAVNAYFDVFVPASSSFSTVQVTDCDLAGGSVVYYYNDTTGQWAEVSGQTYNPGTGCVTFTLGTASTPNLTELSGTEFGVQDAPPSLTAPGNQTVAYHAAASLSVAATDTQPTALTLSANRLPAGLSFTDNGNGTGTVTGIVTAAPSNYLVTFTASDGTVSTTSPPVTITVTKAGTTLTYTGASLVANNRPATLSAELEEGGGSPPMPDGQTVTLTLGSGSSAQSCQGQTQADGWVSCQIATVNQSLGDQPVSATFGGDTYYSASSATGQQSLVFSYLPAGGGFALGDQTVHSATPTTTLTWWGSKWSKSNSLSQGTAPASFKGFAQAFANGPTTVTDPACGGTWTGGTGGTTVPSSVPAYMAVVVPSKVTQTGSTISGNVAEVVIVKTNPGYQPDPSDPGTGTVVGTLCGS
jgi:Putative Ig domain